MGADQTNDRVVSGTGAGAATAGCSVATMPAVTNGHDILHSLLNTDTITTIATNADI